MYKTENIPFTEKYRPTHFDRIILDTTNSKIFDTILKTGYFPNMLLYGPPGTGKTTTIINLTKLYLQKFFSYRKDLIIHLNASDDRGIDMIRNQIQSFAKTDCLFQKGMKIIILDEVDHMTKLAQQSLQYLLSNNASNVRFCLMCNYISRIEVNLKNELITLRFNNLPKKDIYSMLKNICIREQIQYNDKLLSSLICRYNSDIRSMLNYIQNNGNERLAFLNRSNLSYITELLKSDMNINEIILYLNHLSESTKNSIEYILNEYVHYEMNEIKLDDKMNALYIICKKTIRFQHVCIFYRLSYFLHNMRNILTR